MGRECPMQYIAVRAKILLAIFKELACDFLRLGDTRWLPNYTLIGSHQSSAGKTEDGATECFLLYRVIEKDGRDLNRYNLKSTGRIYTFSVLKCSEEFKVLDLP